MLIVVANGNKIYYMKEVTGMGITVSKNHEGKFLLCLDNKNIPIATYKKWESANDAMSAISQAYMEGLKTIVIAPND